MITLAHLKRLFAWLRVARHPDAFTMPPSILPVPSGGYVRVGGILPSYQRWEHSTYIRSATIPAECRRCSWLNPDPTSRGFLHCAVNPLGPETDPCKDYNAIPQEED